MNSVVRTKNAYEYRNYSFSRVKTQNEMTVEYIEKYGSITPLEALTGFGCLRLAARISDLRKAGYNIVTERSEDDAHYAIYRMGVK